MLLLSVVLGVGIVTIGMLAVLLVALVRHLKLLAGSLQRFQQEVGPVLEEIRRGSAEAQQRLERLQERAPGEGSGARLRR